jgi:hypothetical protein
VSRWFRHYAGMMRDDKLVRVAIRSGQTIERVCWVWAAILESAAEIDDEGRYDFDAAEAAYFLRADQSDVDAIETGLADAGRVAAGAVVKWGDRQYQSDRKGGTSRGSETYVYFVGTTWDAAVKIGFSKNPWARAKELQTGSAAKVEVLAHFRTDTNSEVELHNLLAKARHAGEWFNLPDSVAIVVRDCATRAKSYEELLSELRSELRSTTSVGPETETESKEPPKAPRKRGADGKHLLPLDWQTPSIAELPPQARACAEQWTQENYAMHGEAFTSYWRSERRMKADWRGTWANRVIALHSQVMRGQQFGSSQRSRDPPSYLDHAIEKQRISTG